MVGIKEPIRIVAASLGANHPHCLVDVIVGVRVPIARRFGFEKPLGQGLEPIERRLDLIAVLGLVGRPRVGHLSSFAIGAAPIAARDRAVASAGAVLPSPAWSPIPTAHGGTAFDARRTAGWRALLRRAMGRLPSRFDMKF